MTPLPIELTCNVTGVATWSVNDTSYTLGSLTNGALPGHSHSGTNILVNSPVNNTEYICVSSTNDSTTRSNPAYVVITGKYVYMYICSEVYYLNLAVKKEQPRTKKDLDKKNGQSRPV